MNNTYRVYIKNEDELYDLNNISDTCTVEASTFFDALCAVHKKYRKMYLDSVDISLLKGASEEEDVWKGTIYNRAAYTEVACNDNSKTIYDCQWTYRNPKLLTETYDFFFPTCDVEETASFTENSVE